MNRQLKRLRELVAEMGDKIDGNESFMIEAYRIINSLDEIQPKPEDIREAHKMLIGIAARMVRATHVCEKGHRNGERNPHIHFDDLYITDAREIAANADILRRATASSDGLRGALEDLLAEWSATPHRGPFDGFVAEHLDRDDPDFLFMLHGYTCDLCDWGRDAAHNIEEYAVHLRREHCTPAEGFMCPCGDVFYTSTAFHDHYIEVEVPMFPCCEAEEILATDWGDKWDSLPDAPPFVAPAGTAGCEQCGKGMNPAEVILGPVCGRCCRDNHKKAAK